MKEIELLSHSNYSVFCTSCLGQSGCGNWDFYNCQLVYFEESDGQRDANYFREPCGI